MKNKSIVFGCAVILSVLGMQGFAVCPSGDVTGDCIVNLADFAVIARQWLTGDGVPDDMVAIPGGTFVMGDSFNEGISTERPVHIVTLDSFSMSKYEITNGQYREFLYSTQPSVSSGVVYGKLDKSQSYPYFSTSKASSDSQIDFKPKVFPFGLYDTYSVRLKGRTDMSNDPVVMVSWYGAVAYCNWRSKQEGKDLCYDLSSWTCDFTKNGYRLPTEAEWEYAARGRLSGKRFPWGDTITHSQANYYSDSSYGYDTSPTRGYHPTWNDGIEPYTSQVGSFPANGYGLFDMAGNVWEWCNDWYSSGYYGSSPPTNPTGPGTGDNRVIRGGSWNNDTYYCRVTHRVSFTPSNRNDHLGFRLVLD